MEYAQVLLVEDSVGDVLLTQQILSEMPIALQIARNGLEALLMLGDPRFKPALVILDLHMPEISGKEVLVRYHPPDTPVVVFSSSWNEIEKQRMHALGAREYVVKSMDLDEYTKLLRGVVQKWALRDKEYPAAAG